MMSCVGSRGSRLSALCYDPDAALIERSCALRPEIAPLETSHAATLTRRSERSPASQLASAHVSTTQRLGKLQDAARTLQLGPRDLRACSLARC